MKKPKHLSRNGLNVSALVRCPARGYGVCLYLTRRFVNLLETGLFIMVLAVRIFHTPDATAENDYTPAVPFCQRVSIPYYSTNK